MKAVVYQGQHTVAVEDRPDPGIETPLDAVVRLTTTNICGPDLHMYEGRTNVEEGTEGVDGAAYGYANMGPYAGGQAQFLRLPWADKVLLKP